MVAQPNERSRRASSAPELSEHYKLLARLFVGTAQLLLLLLFGHLVYGLRLGHSPIELIVVATAVAAAMTCFAAAVACLVRTREQAIAVGLAVSFALASLGGLFWPLYNLPRSTQTISHGLMTTWSMPAIQDVILKERSFTSYQTNCSCSSAMVSSVSLSRCGCSVTVLRRVCEKRFHHPSPPTTTSRATSNDES